MPPTISLAEQVSTAVFRFIESNIPTARYEYAVLVTSTSHAILTLAQLYRDRADAENNSPSPRKANAVGIIDELKNPRPGAKPAPTRITVGLGRFTTQDLARCRLMARRVALVYNGWTLFVRLAHPQKHFEAIVSRPQLLHGVATQTKHAGQTRLTITSTHAKQATIQAVLTNLAGFLNLLKTTAEQLTGTQRLRAILARAFEKFMLATAGPPVRLANETAG